MTIAHIASLTPSTPTSNDGSWGSVGYLRLYASADYYSSENVFVRGGKPGTDQWCQQYTCPIDGNGLLTIPAIELYSTTDSSVPNVTLTAQLLDSAFRIRGVFLANFFVDPNGLAVSAQSGVTLSAAGVTNTLVAGAGTTADNGIYTLRGTNNGRPFYNLTGQPTDVSTFAIFWSGALWALAGSTGTDYQSPVDKAFPYTPPVTSSWIAVGGGMNPAPTTSASADSTATGMYSYRGQSIDRGYYVLEGFADSSTVSSISWNGSEWIVYSTTGAILYTNATNVTFPWQVSGAWTVVNGTNTIPVASENTALIATTWEAITISNQGQTINFFNSLPTWSVDQIKQYVNEVVGTGDTPYASALVAGKTQLDTNPAIASAPIAIGVNSPTISQIQSDIDTAEADILLKAPLLNPTFTGTVTATSVVASSTVTAGGNVTGANLSGANTGDQTSFSGGSPSARIDLIQDRRGTAAQWTAANPVLSSGEQGFETDTNKVKIGDGIAAWNSLAYLIGTITLSGDVSGSGTTAITTAISANKVTNTMLLGSINQSKLLGSIPASKLVQTDIVLTESQVTNLVTDLALKANLISPSFTTPALGTITAGVLTAGTVATQAAGDNSTKIASTAFVQGRGAGVLVYEATLSQSSTSAPTAQVLVNTLGTTLTYARTSAGLYTATAAAGTPFSTATKVQIFMGSAYGTGIAHLKAVVTSATVITIQTDTTVPGGADDILSNTAFSVIIYP